MLAVMKVAFIGLGKMDWGMARNLLRAGHNLAVYNRSHRAIDGINFWADSRERLAYTRILARRRPT
jgi:3-hydroxyisobutyrate dehydrogenase-like beta-hydroxyacid dehydrogenase